MSIRKSLALTALFWLLASLILLANAWPRAQNHWDVAVVRYIYFCLICIVVSFGIAGVYRDRRFRDSRHRIWSIAAISVVAALVTALLLNPLTYLMVGRELNAVRQEILSTGTLYFALFYFAWSSIFVQLSEKTIHPSGPGRVPPLSFPVEKGGEKRQLRASDICHISAEGDYVQLVTADNAYLHRGTLSSLAGRLDAECFRRVHRSHIVNREKIISVCPKAGGAYEIQMEGSRVVQSSRSYKAVVESILPPG